MKKPTQAKIISFVLIALIFLNITSVYAENEEAEVIAMPTLATDFLFDESTGTITRYVGAGGDVEIPSQINEITVTNIGDGAFYECSSLSSIVIPDTVTSIGDGAFYDCISLTHIIIPESVTSIGVGAFDGCGNLENNIPDAMVDEEPVLSGVLAPDFEFDESTGTITKYIGAGGNVEIPGQINGVNVVSIGSDAFSYCSSLISIAIPSSVTSIGSDAFYNCSSLISIAIPSSVTSIGSYAFYYCISLTSITIPSRVTSIGSSAFYNCSSLISITIPSSVTSIGSSAFSCCTKLVSIAIQNGVTSIGSSAFSYCSSLTSITIPASVTSIGYGVFSYCNGLTSITVNINNTNYLSENGVLFNKVKTTLIQYPGGKSGSYTIPNGVISIESYAFYGCNSLISVIIPISVTNIGSYAFAYCSNLTSITISSNVRSIGMMAFGYCNKLTSITVDANNTMYISEDGVLFNKAKTQLIQYPSGKGGSYTIPDGVTSIGNYAFYNCSSLTSITIPESVTSIQSYTFAYCSSLTSITIPSSVTSIGSYAFYNCSKLPSITIPDSVTSIGDSAFYNCSSLLSITISNSVTSIGNSAFSNCSNLTSITIPSNVTSIGNFAFSNCSNLTSIIVPNSVISIGNYAFNNCSNLTSITIPESVTSIGISAFNNCSNLTIKTFPDCYAEDYAKSHSINISYINDAISGDTQPPTVPTGLIATGATETSVAFSWNASTDNTWIAGYEVYRNGVKIGSTPGITFTSIPLTPNKSYTFTVKAYDAAGNYSNESTPLTTSTLPDTQAPSIPTGLTATNITERTVTLQWNASTDNVALYGYAVYRNGTRIGTAFNTEYVYKNLLPNTSYTLGVVAIDNAPNYSNMSEPLTVLTLADTQAPTAPTNLRQTDKTDTSVSITWDASTDNVWVTGYEVYRNGVKIGSTPGITFTSIPLTPNKSYIFTVKAYDAAGNYSNESTPLTASTLPDTQAPSIPTGLTATNITERTVTLQWNASTDNVALYGYAIYRNGTRIGTAFNTEYVYKNLLPNTSYTLGVVAIDNAPNYSNMSEPLTVLTLADTQAPTAPTNLRQTDKTDTSVSIAWDASTDNVWVTGYEVYRNGVKVGSTPGITFTSIPLTPNKSYTFTVKAYDAAGNYSNESTPLTASTLAGSQ